MKNYVIDKPTQKSKISIAKGKITLENEWLRRVIDTSSGTTSYFDKIKSEELLGQVNCEGYFLIDGKKYRLFEELKYTDCIQCLPQSDIHYESSPYASEKICYPPEGKAVQLNFTARDLQVKVVYELYDNLPCICKKVSIVNNSGKSILLQDYCIESLMLNDKGKNRLYCETDYNGGDSLNNNRCLSVQSTQKENYYLLNIRYDMGPDYDIAPEEEYKGMKVFELIHLSEYYEQRLIEIKHMYRTVAPWVTEAPVFQHLIADNPKKVRQAIDDAQKLGVDMIIQSFGSGIKMHSKSQRYINKHKKLYDYAHSKGIKMGAYTLAIVKNYMPIITRECNVYADPKGRIFRCLACDWSKKYWKRIFGFCDKTGLDAIEIDGPYHFLKCSGGKGHLHKGLSDSRHLQWKLSTVEVFRNIRNRKMYVNAPDWLYLNGNNKAGIGYEEIAFSQPRQEQLITTRIYNYKGTFGKIPSMGWSFLPVSVYHGGGDKASFAPLDKNVFDYDWMLFENLVAGIMPCIRGKMLYDDDKSYEVIKKHIEFYKKYKYVINGDTIHFLPPVQDKNNPCRTVDIDGILNVRSQGKIRGMLALFNQTDREIAKTIRVPVYYTGLCKGMDMPAPYEGCNLPDVQNPKYGEYYPPYAEYEGNEQKCSKAVSGYGDTVFLQKEKYPAPQRRKTELKVKLRQEDKKEIICDIDSNCDIELTVTMRPMSYTWYTISEEKGS